MGENRLPSSFVAGVEPWEPTRASTDAIVDLEFHFLPFATAGYVSISLDTRGGQWLTLTAAGREAIAEPPTPPEDYDDWNLIEAASDVYEAAFSAARQELSVAKPDHPNNFIIPRVPSGWGNFLGYLELVRKQAQERERDCEAMDQ